MLENVKYLMRPENEKEKVRLKAEQEKLGELQMKNHPEWNCIPLYSDISYVCYSSRVKGINILPNGFIYWNDLSL